MGKDNIISNKVWEKLFPFRRGDKVRFLGLSRRWQVGKIIKMHTYKYTVGKYFTIETRRGKNVFHSHLTLKSGEIEIWRKRR